MGKIMKNLLSLTLALLLTVSLAAGNLMSVSAEDEEIDLEETTEEVVEDETSEDDEEDTVPEAEEAASEDEEESPVQVYSTKAEETDESDEYEVSTYAEMPDAVGDVINLTEDVVLDETYVVDGETVTINLNGFTVSLTEGVDGSVIEVTDEANVTINGKDENGNYGTITGGDGHLDGSHREGGGIYVEGSSITLNNVTIAYNHSTNYEGGGIYAVDSEVAINGSTISNNSIVTDSSSTNGGGIFVSGGTLNVAYSTFSWNTGHYGGAIEIDGDCTAEISNCEFDENVAYYAGGALHVQDQVNVTVEGCTFNGNTAATYGGGAYGSGSGGETISFKNCDFTENSTTNYGGGAAISGTVTAYFEGCNFTGNETTNTSTNAYGGGGLYLDNYSDEPDTEVIDCTFDSNISGSYGGGISARAYNRQHNYLMRNNTITNNTAAYGGGMFLRNSEGFGVVIYDTIICNNHASNVGGAIYLDWGTCDFEGDGNIVCNNTAVNGGADIAKTSTSITAASELTFFDAASMDRIYEADEENQFIDGWYVDSPEDRYEISHDGQEKEFSNYYSEYFDSEDYNFDDYYIGVENNGNSGSAVHNIYLVASYTLKDFDVTFLEGEHGTLGEEATDTIIRTVEGGSSVEVPGVNPDEGYVFDHWEGTVYRDSNTSEIQTFSAADGTYSSEEIAALKINQPMTFTAVYEPATIDEEPEEQDETIEGQNLNDDDSGLDSGNGGNGTGLDNLDDGNNDADLSLDEDVDADYVNDESDGEVEELSDEEAEDSDSVKTGDSTSMLVYIAGLGLSIAGLSAFYARRKRNYNG